MIWVRLRILHEEWIQLIVENLNMRRKRNCLEKNQEEEGLQNNLIYHFFHLYQDEKALDQVFLKILFFSFLPVPSSYKIINALHILPFINEISDTLFSQTSDFIIFPYSSIKIFRKGSKHILCL